MSETHINQRSVSNLNTFSSSGNFQSKAAMEVGLKEESQQVVKVLEALKQASQDLHHNPTSPTSNSSSSPIKALLELQSEADNILSNDPNLSNLSTQISNLKHLLDNLDRCEGHSIRSFLRRRVNSYEISCVATSIETELQAWIDRESIENLVKSLPEDWSDEDDKVKMLCGFIERVSQGFDLNLQDLVLRSKVFSVLESVLCNPSCPKGVREKSALAMSSLVKFNKDVFLGEVLMGCTVKALILMGSCTSIQVLCSLIKSIKSPFVDEIELKGGIPKIINLLSSQAELSIKLMAFDCVLEIGYFGRKEAIEEMLKDGLVKKLVELQRSELGGDLIGIDGYEDDKEVKNSRGKKGSRERRFLGEHPFVSCVARFGIQLEVGQGLRQREKRWFKQEIVKLVREACVSDAEAATIVAEVLWGSSP